VFGLIANHYVKGLVVTFTVLIFCCGLINQSIIYLEVYQVKHVPNIVLVSLQSVYSLCVGLFTECILNETTWSCV
jgi:hypothetical protein